MSQLINKAVTDFKVSSNSLFPLSSFNLVIFQSEYCEHKHLPLLVLFSWSQICTISTRLWWVVRLEVYFCSWLSQGAPWRVRSAHRGQVIQWWIVIFQWGQWSKGWQRPAKHSQTVKATIAYYKYILGSLFRPQDLR